MLYHVSTMLPFEESDAQKIQRKRHIGNDLVTLVFMEPGATFSPRQISSKFLHVFITIQHEGQGGWRVGIARRYQVPPFGPVIEKELFTDGVELREFLMAKSK
jgi:hypothetical protein